MSTTTAAPEANPLDSKAMPPGLKPARIADKAFVIPLDKPKEGAASEQGFYITPLSLTWFLESVRNEAQLAQANVALLSVAAATGLDALDDDQLMRVFGGIEDQLSRCVAMAEEALRRMIINDWSAK